MKDLPNLIFENLTIQFNKLNSIKGEKFKDFIELFNDMEIKVIKLVRDVTGSNGLSDKFNELNLSFNKFVEENNNDLEIIKYNQKISLDKSNTDKLNNSKQFEKINTQYTDLVEIYSNKMENLTL